MVGGVIPWRDGEWSKGQRLCLWTQKGALSTLWKRPGGRVRAHQARLRLEREPPGDSHPLLIQQYITRSPGGHWPPGEQPSTLPHAADRQEPEGSLLHQGQEGSELGGRERYSEWGEEHMKLEQTSKGKRKWARGAGFQTHDGERRQHMQNQGIWRVQTANCRPPCLARVLGP